jgi:hypothetical protein
MVVVGYYFYFFLSGNFGFRKWKDGERLFAFAFFYNLGPGIPQGCRPVEYQGAMAGINRVRAEVAGSFKLVPAPRSRIPQAGFHPAFL